MRLNKHTALILAARAAAESGHQDASDALLRRALKRESNEEAGNASATFNERKSAPESGDTRHG